MKSKKAENRKKKKKLFHFKQQKEALAYFFVNITVVLDKEKN